MTEQPHKIVCRRKTYLGTDIEPPSYSETVQMLRDCKEARACLNHPFTAWELEFLASVIGYWNKFGELTEKQALTLMKIWDKI